MNKLTLPRPAWALLAALALGAAASLAWPHKPAPTSAELAQWGTLAAVNDLAATEALRQAARAGIVPAQQALGRVLVERPGTQAVAEGRQWLAQAAQAQDARAQLALGKLLFKGGPGVAADPAAALPLLKAAVDGGQAGAAYYLGLIYKNGNPRGTAGALFPADAQAAAHWLQVAAQAGVADAQFLLGQMLLAGDGLAADPAQARLWFEKAAEQEHPEANLQLLMARTRGELGYAQDAQATAQQYAEAQHSLRHRPPSP